MENPGQDKIFFIPFFIFSFFLHTVSAGKEETLSTKIQHKELRT